MNLDKAILTKESYLRNFLCNFNEEERHADQISIEALKEVKRLRPHIHYHVQLLLPGETKD